MIILAITVLVVLMLGFLWRLGDVIMRWGDE
jgi:hypothetical protein